MRWRQLFGRFLAIADCAIDKLTERLADSDVVDAELVAHSIRALVDERALTIVHSVIGGEFERIADTAKRAADGRTVPFADRRRNAHAPAGCDAAPYTEFDRDRETIAATDRVLAGIDAAAPRSDDPPVGPVSSSDREFAAYKRGLAAGRAERLVLTSYDFDAIVDVLTEYNSVDTSIGVVAGRVRTALERAFANRTRTESVPDRDGRRFTRG